MMSTTQLGWVPRVLLVVVMASAACEMQNGRRLAAPLDAGSLGGGGDSDQADPSSDTAPADSPPVVPGVSTIAGGPSSGLVDGPGPASLFDNPVNVAVAPDGVIYIADYGNSAIRRVRAGVVSTCASGIPMPFGLALAADGALLVVGDDGVLRRIDVRTGHATPLTQGLGLARGVLPLPNGNVVVTALQTHVLWLVAPDGTTSILAGALGQAGMVDATGADARFDEPIDVVLLADETIAVADLRNSRIRRVSQLGVVSTLAGTTSGFLDGPAAAAQFDGPSGLALSRDGTLYVSDRFNRRIRKVTADGMVRTVAGDGVDSFLDSPQPLQAEFAEMEGLDLSLETDLLYVADGNAIKYGDFHRIRQVTLGL